MGATPDPYDYSTETLLRAEAAEVAELRGLLAAVAGDLERLACAHPEHAERFLTRRCGCGGGCGRRAAENLPGLDADRLAGALHDEPAVELRADQVLRGGVGEEGMRGEGI